MDSLFNYAPLIWMFAGKTAISMICKIHYRTLQVVYNNFTDLHDALLSISNDMSICQEYMCCLAVQVYKARVEINPEFM